MSRLTKLWTRPGAYFRDGADNFLTRHRPLGNLAAWLRVPRASAHSGALADELILRLVGTAKVHRRGEVLHCSKGDVPWVLAHAWRLARDRGLQLPLADLRAAHGADAFALRFTGEDEIRFEVSDAAPGASHFIDVGRLYSRPDDAAHGFDIDVVYTWVNHADPWWRAAIREHKRDDEIEWDRFTNRDELRYSMRSVHDFAPWVRTIFLVTNCSPPAWLAEDPRVRVMPHEAIFPKEAALPTFNSHAIEACLHRIDGLSEHFVYFNDDMFLGRATSKATFFTREGLSISYLERDGMVTGDNAAHRLDYMNAAINGRELCREELGFAPTRLHQHVPYALRVSVLRDMEATFADDFARVRNGRFRSRSDISSVSFLYHHFAHAKQQAIIGDEPGLLIQASHAARAFERLLHRPRQLFFCINDGQDSTSSRQFQQAKDHILESCFPNPAPWEKAI